jgi:hypothetical protein
MPTNDAPPPGPADRRRHPRRPIQVTTRCRRAGGRTHDEEVQTIDLSEGGAGILGSDRFAVGDVVDLQLEVDGRPLDYRGLIVGSRPADVPGKLLHNVAFRTLDDARIGSLRSLLDTADGEAG